MILASVSTRVKNSFNTNTGHCDTKNIFANYWILLSDNLPIFEKSLLEYPSSSVPSHSVAILYRYQYIITGVIFIKDIIQILIEYKLLATVCSSSSFGTLPPHQSVLYPVAPELPARIALHSRIVLFVFIIDNEVLVTNIDCLEARWD